MSETKAAHGGKLVDLAVSGDEREALLDLYYPADRVIRSGTQVREMLKGGLVPSPEFTRPEVAEVLVQAMQERTTPDHAV